MYVIIYVIINIYIYIYIYWNLESSATKNNSKFKTVQIKTILQPQKFNARFSQISTFNGRTWQKITIGKIN